MYGDKTPIIPRTYEVCFQEKVANECERVITFVLDGAGKFKTNTPFLDKLSSSGASSFNTEAVFPTDSAQNWGSIIHGVFPEKHNLEHEELEAGNPYPEESPYSSIFKILWNKFKNIKMASFVGWSPINTGMIELSIPVNLYSPLTHEDKSRQEELRFEHHQNKNSIYDQDVTSRVIDYINNPDNNDVKFIFIHLTDVDEHGHDYGFGLPEHLKQIQIADSQIGQILQAIEKKGWKNNSLKIITTDHGGINEINSDGSEKGKHGGNDPQEVDVFLIVNGPGIKPNSEIKSRRQNGKLLNMDCAAIILKSLGIEPPEWFDAKLPFIALAD